jgi:tagatose-1,6-bisphosphate aldolase non-catalytic subunit AgaZ/GatZ
MDKTKLQNAKNWVSAHKEELSATALVTAFLSVVTGITYYAVKAENKQIAEYNAKAAEMNEWFETTTNEGNDIYQLAMGGYLVVPKTGPQQYYIK